MGWPRLTIFTLLQMFTSVRINAQLISVRNAFIRECPLLANYSVGDLEYILPAPFNDCETIDILLVSRLALGDTVNASVVYSFKDLYWNIRLAQLLGVSNDRIIAATVVFTSSPKWLKLADPEYMYPLWMLYDHLVDFPVYFRSATQVGAAFAPLNDKHIPAQLLIDRVEFLANYEFNTLFMENNDVIQRRITRLERARAEMGNHLLVNPHNPTYEGLLTAKPSIESNVWDCAGIAVMPAPAIGAPAIVDIATAKARFEEFTCGIFNDNLPYENIVFAGGSISKILQPHYQPKHARQSDCDMFIIGKDYNSRAKAFQEVIGWFRKNHPGAYYAVRGSVCTVYILNVPRKFQIMSIDKSTAFEIISRFDLSHIQWAYYCGQFLGTAAAIDTFRTRVARMTNPQKIRVERLIKVLYSGFSILRDNKTAEVDITELVANPAGDQMQKYIRGLHGYYYPMMIAGLDDDEQRQHILCMIEKDANAEIVSTDPQFVVNNTTINGSFDSDYYSMSYTTFNPTSIVNHHPGRKTFMCLRTKHGNISLGSPMLKLSAVEGGDIITLTAPVLDQEFKDFILGLENTTLKIFKPAGVGKRFIRADGSVSFTITRRRAEYAIKNQRGAQLTPGDLNAGDTVQIMFNIHFHLGDVVQLNLAPFKIIKYCDGANAVVASEPELTAEACEINYEI